MTLEQLKKEVKEAMELDSVALDKESLNISVLTNKFLNLRLEEKSTLHQLEKKYKKLFKEKWEYYLGRSSPEVYRENPLDLKILKGEVNIYIDADDDIQKLKERIQFVEEKIKYLDSIISILNQRSFNIKNAIAWQQFINGGDI